MAEATATVAPAYLTQAQRYKKAWDFFYAKLTTHQQERVQEAMGQEGRPLPVVEQLIKDTIKIGQNEEIDWNKPLTDEIIEKI